MVGVSRDADGGATAAGGDSGGRKVTASRNDAGGTGRGTTGAPAEISRAPTRVSMTLALVAALVSVLAAALSAPLAAVPGLVGVLGVGIAFASGSRRALGLGTLALLVGSLLAGIADAPPESLLVGVLCALLAWDLGENGITMGRQLGRAAGTRRAEVVHAGASLFVGALAATVAYGTYRSVAGGQPATALVFLLIGALALVAAIRN